MIGAGEDVAPARPVADLERQTVARTRRTIRMRSWILAWAVLCTMLPMTIAFDDGGVTFIMLRDQPKSALLWLAAAAFWYQYVRLSRAVRGAGL